MKRSEVCLDFWIRRHWVWDSEFYDSCQTNIIARDFVKDTRYKSTLYSNFNITHILEMFQPNGTILKQWVFFRGKTERRKKWRSSTKQYDELFFKKSLFPADEARMRWSICHWFAPPKKKIRFSHGLMKL